MFHLRKLYLFDSRRCLVSKFNFYRNVNQISCIKFLNLAFFKLKKKSLVLLSLGFFFFIINKKGFVIPSKKKLAKKTFSSSLKLKDDEIFIFLEKFLRISVYNLTDLGKGFLKKSFSNTGTFSFNIQDIFSFLELDDFVFKFRKLTNLNITLNFSFNNKLENIEVLRSLGFFYR